VPHYHVLDWLEDVFLDPSQSRLTRLMVAAGKGRFFNAKVFSAMITRMTWPELCQSERFQGLWVALDNCRYDHTTRQPVEGDVVDSDEDLSQLCTRMRETGRGSCAILYCDEAVVIESAHPPELRPEASRP
jgi:hypothetical protein